LDARRLVDGGRGVGEQGLLIEGVRVGGDDVGDGHLTGVPVRAPDRRGTDHRRVSEQRLLDHPRVDVVPENRRTADRENAHLTNRAVPDESAVDQFAAAALRLLGVPADDATRLAALTLPATGVW
jgi:hypothetical protein